MLRAITNMNRPQRYQLPQPHLRLRIRIPEAYSEYACIVSQHDFEASLRRSLRFARPGGVVQVYDAAPESQVARARLEGAQVCFFVVKLGLGSQCWCIGGKGNYSQTIGLVSWLHWEVGQSSLLLK